MTPNPLISVVMPVYGTEAYIGKSIQSLINQTFKNFELVLVDDESPDNCPQMCDEYAQTYDFVSVIHQKNKRQGGARNTGILSSKGEYVFFMDSDDVIQPDTFEYFANVINNHKGVDLVFSNMQRVSIGDEFKKATVDNGTAFFSRFVLQKSFLLNEVVVLCPGACYRREWMIQNRISFKGIPYSEDVLFVWDSLLYVNSAIHIRKDLYNYLLRPGSVMTSSTLLKIEKGYPYFKELESRYKASNADDEVKRFLLSRWVIGILHSSAKLCTFEEYKRLCKLYEASKHCKILPHFPQKKIAGLAYLYSLSPRVFYWICRRV